MENKKEVDKAFDNLTVNILDKYNNYKLEHKILVKEQLMNFQKLNDVLSVYDDKRQIAELKKEFQKLKDQILDNYDDYSEEHKKMVISELQKYKELNEVLDVYDKPNEVEKKKTLIDFIFIAFGIKK